MKGIILAAGSSKRLYPITKGIPKPLLPIYDKPMIYYTVSVLMETDITDIMVIVSPTNKEYFVNMLGDGTKWGINIVYEVQEVPRGVADAFKVAKDFIGNDSSVLILGDNLFLGIDLKKKLDLAKKYLTLGYASIFGYEVEDASRFGVLEFDKDGSIISLEEKPEHPKSNIAATGLYFYDASVCEKFSLIKPSSRGEYEITDINNIYLNEGKLKGILLDKGNYFWHDAGTYESLLDASNTVKKLEDKQGKLISVPEEIAYRKGLITKEALETLAKEYEKTAYGEYLMSLID